MRVDHLSALADRFDGMIIDQFGVLHDGQSLYPGTLEVLRGLQASRIPIVVVTNSGKRIESNRQRLLDIGIPRDTFVDVISSGEVAWRRLVPPSSRRARARGSARGRRVWRRHRSGGDSRRRA